MLEDKDRKRCVLKILGSNENFYLSLTEDQINFFNWLYERDIICCDDYDLKVVGNDFKWTEI